MSKAKKSKRTGIVIIVLIGLIIAAFISKLIYQNYFTPSMNIAYSEEYISLYAGPGTEYAPEGFIQGYFEYDFIDSKGWMQVHCKNSLGENILRWLNTSELTSWGVYRYNIAKISD